jgi:phage terminase small subunit
MVSGVADLDWPPDPPSRLNALARAEWRAVVHNLNSEALPRECLPLLAVWCAVKVDLDGVMAALSAFEPGLPAQSNEELKTYNRLILMRGKLASQLGNLSVKLRLMPQSRADAHKAAPSAGGKPWRSRLG